MRRVDQLADEIVQERYHDVRALFLRRRAGPPFLLWRPRESDLPVPMLANLLHWWAQPPPRPALPADLPEAGHLAMIEPLEGGHDFVYRRYGPALVRAFGHDLTGRRVSAQGGHVALFNAAVYRAVLQRQEPIYTAHEPASELVSRADRLVLPLVGDDGVVGLMAGIVTEAPFRSLVDIVMDAVLVFDQAGRILVANAPAAALLGYSAEKLVGQPVTEVLQAGFVAAGLGSGEGIVTAAREASVRRADGSACPVEVSIGESRRELRRLFVAVLRDITARKAEEDRYRALALTDPLTGLANRTLFQDRLGQALARSRRSGRPVALHLIDLDGFKAINDRFGHPTGDRVLQAFAERVRPVIRETDVLARLGGDEFALVQTELAHAGGAALLADRVLEALEEPLRIDGQRVAIRASLGVALHPEQGSTVEQLTEHADCALYRAKRRGGRCRVLFAEAQGSGSM
jgi:diguanylate cyclase (GGDEF)-like protein/PAS domain S-box-containing protein